MSLSYTSCHLAKSRDLCQLRGETPRLSWIIELRGWFHKIGLLHCDKDVPVKDFTCDTRKPTVPSNPSASCELTEEQKQRPHKADDPTTVPYGCLLRLK